MTTDATTGLGALYAALSKAQGAMRGAEKDRTNPQFSSQYATLASVWDAVRAPLAANGLAVIQTISDEDGGLVLVTSLVHASGGCVVSRYPVRPVQATPQGTGSAVTYARKYSLAAICGVAPADDDDGNAASAGPAAPSVAPTKARASKPAAAVAAPAVVLTPSQWASRVGECQTLAQLDVVEADLKRVWQALPEDARDSLRQARLDMRAAIQMALDEPPADVVLPVLAKGGAR